MVTLVLRNVPDDLYQQLKDAAAEHHRAVAQEAIAMLEGAFRPEPEITPEPRPKLTWKEFSEQMKDLWSLPVVDPRTPDEIMGYDENGLPT